MHIYQSEERDVFLTLTFLMLNTTSFDFCAYFEKVREIEITQLESK